MQTAASTWQSGLDPGAPSAQPAAPGQPATAAQPASANWYPSTPAGYSPPAGSYAAAGPYAASGGKSGRVQISFANRGRLLNILIYGVAPLVLVGIVVIAFVLNSPGKSVNASRTGFKAGAAASTGQQQPQGSGSSAASAPGAMPKAPASSKTTKPGKRSSMPTGLLPAPSTGSGSDPGSKPKHSSKPKPKRASGPVTPTDLGQPNFDGYCGHIGEGSAVTTNSTAYGWACSSESSVPLQVNSACAWTFHLKTSQVVNVTTDYHSVTSWQCWRTNGMLGLLNITTYCTSAGLGAVKLTADNAYGWTCGGNPIDTNAGCQAQFGNSNAFSRFEIWTDPNTWQCWD